MAKPFTPGMRLDGTLYTCTVCNGAKCHRRSRICTECVVWMRTLGQLHLDVQFGNGPGEDTPREREQRIRRYIERRSLGLPLINDLMCLNPAGGSRSIGGDA